MTALRQLPLALAHRPALGMADFLVADCNREAVAWIDRWPDWPAPALVVSGPPACGKTHLSHVWQARTGAVTVSAAGPWADPPAILGRAQACVVEDGSGELSAADERAFLHLYNWLAERGGHLLVTAQRAPARWRMGLPDLASRLGTAVTVTIGPPDDALIAAVLVKLFADCQLAVGREVIAYLVARMERSFEAARGLVAAVDAAALASHRRVTVPLVREVLTGAALPVGDGDGH